MVEQRKIHQCQTTFTQQLSAHLSSLSIFSKMKDILLKKLWISICRLWRTSGQTAILRHSMLLQVKLGIVSFKGDCKYRVSKISSSVSERSVQDFKLIVPLYSQPLNCVQFFFRVNSNLSSLLQAVVNEDTQGNVSQLQAEVKKLKEQLSQLLSGQMPQDLSIARGEMMNQKHFLLPA